MITQQQERFVWREGDIVVAEEPKAQDQRVMSESERAFFLKSQTKDKR